VIKTTSLKSDKVKIEIFDAVGKTVLIRNISLPTHDVQLDLLGLDNGIYLIHVKDGSGSLTQKLVLSR
jgi:hypothetical protein